MAKYLADLSKDEFWAFVNSFDQVLLDCDGVVYTLFKVLPGVPEAINAFKILNKTIKYVTNNTTTDKETVTKTMKEQGVFHEPADIINPTTAIIHYLKKINFDKEIFLIGLPSMAKEFQEAGLQVANEYKPDVIEVSVPALIKSLTFKEEVGAVVVCFDFNMTINTLNKAYNYITNPDVLYITTGYDKIIPVGNNRSILGQGFIHDVLTEASGRKPIALGKPLQGFQDYIKDIVRGESKRILFIGDSLHQDIEFAKEMGFQSCYVLTGCGSLEKLNAVENHLKPDYYMTSLSEFYTILNKNK